MVTTIWIAVAAGLALATWAEAKDGSAIGVFSSGALAIACAVAAVMSLVGVGAPP